jgi:hypothetical protein
MEFVHGFLRRFVARWACGLLVLAGLSGSVTCWASTLSAVPVAAPTSGGFALSYGSGGTSLAAVGRGVTAANDIVAVADTALLPTSGGSASVVLTRTVSGVAVRAALVDTAFGLARGGLIGAAAVAAGVVLQPVVDKLMQDMGYTKAAGVWSLPGSPSPVSYVAGSYCYNGSCGTDRYGLMDSLISAAGITHSAGMYGGSNICDTSTGVGSTPPDGACVQTFFSGQPGGWQSWRLIYHASAGSVCPDGFAVSSGHCSGAAGGAVSIADAKAASASQPLPPSQYSLPSIFDSMDTLGYAPALSDSVAVTGPAQVVGTGVVSTTVQTSPSGATSTVTEMVSPVSKLAYSGNTVTVTDGVIKTVNNPDGSTSVTRTDSSPNTGPCLGLAGALGCTQLGTPEAASVPTASRAVSFAAESINLPSACPSPISMGKFGELSFESACTNAGYMRPLILAGAAFIALMICVSAVAGAKT